MESSSRSKAPFPVMPLVAMGLGVLILANDFSALNVALRRSRRTSTPGVHRAVGGERLRARVRDADVAGGGWPTCFGRGACSSSAPGSSRSFSILGGAAQDIDWLIAARCLMGIGGALMWPAILGMTYAALPEEKAGLAGGLILGAAGLGNVIALCWAARSPIC